MNQARGQAAEDAALVFLQGKGLTLLGRNHRCRLGEIDLVMLDGESLVFVEVRARRGQSHGGALASVGAAKQRRIAAAARHYLMSHPREALRPARFDVVAISAAGSENPIQWIRAAFDCAS
jgi:putative endonuclease